MAVFETRDHGRLFYKDWGEGPPIVFLHAYAVTCDAWDYQMSFLARHGIRCITFDRRGHGRSDHPGYGYDFDTLSDDLAALLDHLGLERVSLVGHSMGAGEIVRYLSRNGSARVACAVLVSPITPFLIKTEDNPGGLDPSILDSFVKAIDSDFPNTMSQITSGFWGENGYISLAMKEWIHLLGLQTSLIGARSCLQACWLTDFRRDLAAVDVPTLVIHGDNDPILPLNQCGRPTAEAISNARLVVYESVAHGLPLIERERFNHELLQSIRSHI